MPLSFYKTKFSYSNIKQNIFFIKIHIEIFNKKFKLKILYKNIIYFLCKGIDI